MGGGVSTQQDYLLPPSTINNPLSSSFSGETSTGRMNLKENNKNSQNLKVDVSVYILYPEIIQWKEHFQMLKFNETEVGKLYRLYKRMRLPDSEEASVDKLLRYCSLEESPLMHKYFHILSNSHGNISTFYDFVITLWHYCTISKDLSSLIFDLYDTENQRHLDSLVADRMIKDIYGKKFDNSRVALQLIVRLQRQSPKVVHRYFFKEFIYANSILLQPCYVYRRRITDVFLGKQVWDRLEQERIILTRGTYYHIRDILSMTEQYASLIKKQAKFNKSQAIITVSDSTSNDDGGAMDLHSRAAASSSSSVSIVSHTVRASTAPADMTKVAARRNRQKTVGYQTADITLGNRTLKPIVQRGEYDESIQLIIKPEAPTRAPKRIQGLTCYNHLA